MLLVEKKGPRVRWSFLGTSLNLIAIQLANCALQQNPFSYYRCTCPMCKDVQRCSCKIFVQKSASCSLVPDQARFFPGISCISRRSHFRDIAAALSNPLMQLIKSLIILPCPFFKSLCKKYLRKGLQKHNLCKRYFWLKCAKSTCSQFWRSPALTCSN